MKTFAVVIALAFAALLGGTAHAQTVITWDSFSKPVYGSYWYCNGYTWTTCTQCYLRSYEDYLNQCADYVNAGWDPNYLSCAACNWTQGWGQVGWTQLSDGDVITYEIESGKADTSGIEFRLIAGSNASRWKEIDLGVTDRWKVWTQDGKSWCNWPSPSTLGCNTIGEWTPVIQSSNATVYFSKVKASGIHTRMYVLKNLGAKLKGGDRVTFYWHEG
jgi:hypothetical protein